MKVINRTQFNNEAIIMHKIEWTDKTWNVITGCTQISPACDNCYAKAMTKRLQGMAKKEAHKSMKSRILYGISKRLRRNNEILSKQ